MSETRTPVRSLAPLWRGLIAATMVVAGGLHVGQVQVHLEEWKPAGIFFIAVALLQIGLGVALGVAPSARLRVAALAVSVPTVVLWAASRSVGGLPGGPHSGVPEAVDAAGVIATSLELVTITILASWGSGWVRRRLPLAVRMAALTVLFATVGMAGATGEWTSECAGARDHAGEGRHADSVAGDRREQDHEHASDPNELLKNHGEHDVLDSFKRLDDRTRHGPDRESAPC